MNTKSVIIQCFMWSGALLLLAAAFFFIIYRPTMVKWGTTREEQKKALPGDELLNDHAFSYTQAITIKAPKEIVWAYLIQVGYQRAGWYNVDWINGMIKGYFYEGGRSANRIIPEFQTLAQGDIIKIVPEMGFVVSEIKETETLLLLGYEPGSKQDATPLISTWVFTLEEREPGAARLVTRFKTKYPDALGLKIMMAVVNEAGGAGLQQPAMLRGLKRRAEVEFIKKGEL